MRDRSKGTYLAHILFLAVAALAVLFPFVNKAFHVDDTLFLWTARQIVERPWDFYGFQSNWDGVLSPAINIMKNPPVAAYYMAFAGWLGGFSEKTLHLAFIFPAFMALWATYALARRMGTTALVAAFLLLATPAFLVSSTTLMCDVMLAAFWVWAVFFWVKGVEDSSEFSLLAAGCLIALASLTKYFGISLIPLLAVYSLIYGRKGVRSLAFLVVPALALAGYHFYTEILYGRGLLLDAYLHSAVMAGGAEWLDRSIVGLVFAGGCLITVLFFLVSIWGIKALMAASVLIAASAVYFVSRKSLGAVELWTGSFGWGYALQLAVYGAAVAGIVLLWLIDFIRRRDAYSALLGMWIAGTLVFTVFFNWTVNARSILPMAPAVAILLARAAEDSRAGVARLAVPVALSLAVSLSLAWSDYSLAGSARDAANAIADKYSGGPGKLWFQGHRGFQYYLEARGAKAIEWDKGEIKPGDAVAYPLNNIGLRLLPGDEFTIVEEFRYAPFPFVSTMTAGPGAGFYASERGPMPFMLFPPNDERYQVLVPKKTD